MNCVICKHGRTQAGQATVTLESNGATLVVKSVPAEVCDNCGEEYVEEDVAENLLQEVRQAAEAGVRLEMREYAAA